MTAAIADEHIAEYVLGVVESVKADGNHYRPYGYDGNQLFFDRIAAATRDHFGISTAGEAVDSSMSAAATGLVDSVPTGPWIASYAKYNCYSYAIDMKDSFLRPGFRRAPSANYRTYLLPEGKVDTIAALAVDDLIDMGKKCVYYTSTQPSSSVLSSASMVICVRITSRTAETKDFHFMRYDKSNSKWFHKPNISAILRYNHKPWSKTWTNEGLFPEGYMLGGISYTSTIYYIIVYDSHGDTKCTYTVPSMKHNIVCKRCDRTVR